MSIDGTLFEFFIEPNVSKFLKIEETDEEDIILLRGIIGPSADKFVKNALKPFADSFPLAADLQGTAESAAFKKAVSLYKGYNNNTDAMELWKGMAQTDINELKTTLKASHAERTKLAVASQSYDTEDDILFSQSIR